MEVLYPMKIFTLFFLIFLFSTVQAKPLSIVSSDGFVLKGFLNYPEIKKDKYPVIIFAHQFSTTHVIWSDFAKRLNQLGYATLLIDLRGHGLSTIKNGKKVEIIPFKGGSLANLFAVFKKSNELVNFKLIPEDIVLWIEYLKENEKIDEKRIGLVGSSLGATSVIPVVLDEDLSFVISISPGSPSLLGDKEKFELALSSFLNPFLFVASVNDPIGSGKYIQRYVEKTPNGISMLLSGNKHGVSLLPRIEEMLIAFIQKHL